MVCYLFCMEKLRHFLALGLIGWALWLDEKSVVKWAHLLPRGKSVSDPGMMKPGEPVSIWGNVMSADFARKLDAAQRQDWPAQGYD